jgi:hypothetical protein
MPQPKHMNLRMLPCTSITRSGELPAIWCSSSMFWVMSAWSFFLFSSSTSARWLSGRVAMSTKSGRSRSSISRYVSGLAMGMVHTFVGRRGRALPALA